MEDHQGKLRGKCLGCNCRLFRVRLNTNVCDCGCVARRHVELQEVRMPSTAAREKDPVIAQCPFKRMREARLQQYSKASDLKNIEVIQLQQVRVRGRVKNEPIPDEDGCVRQKIQLKPPLTIANILDICSTKFLGQSLIEAGENKRLVLLRTGKGPRIENDEDLIGRKLLYFLSYERFDEESVFSSLSYPSLPGTAQASTSNAGTSQGSAPPNPVDDDEVSLKGATGGHAPLNSKWQHEMAIEYHVPILEAPASYAREGLAPWIEATYIRVSPSGEFVGPRTSGPPDGANLLVGLKADGKVIFQCEQVEQEDGPMPLKDLEKSQPKELRLLWQSAHKVYLRGPTGQIGAVFQPLYTLDVHIDWYREEKGCYTIMKDQSGPIITVGEGLYKAKALYFGAKPQEAWSNPIHVVLPSQMFKGDGAVRCLESSKYSISTKVLGKGGFGKVFRGEYHGPVAVKVVDLNNESIDSRMLKAEVELASRIRHPNLVQILGFSFPSSELHIVMELIDGKDILVLRKKGKLSDKEKLDVAVQVCNAISYLHSIQLVHGDVKPTNVMVREDMCVKVLDFSLLRLKEHKDLQTTQTARTAIPGTPAYQAPEHFLGGGEKVQPSGDVWSLGATLIGLWADPWPKKISMGIISGIYSQRAPLPGLAQVPSEVRAVLSGALSYDVKERVKASQLGQALQEL